MHKLRFHGGAGGDAPGAIRHAHAYELFSAVAFLGSRRRTYTRLATLAGVTAGDRVLDIGCGPGYLTAVAAHAAAPEGSAVGVDVSPPMIEEARRLRSSGSCTFEVGRAEALDFPDGSFDVIVSSLAVHHIPEEHRAAAYTEMHRVLRPGGRALIADFRPPRRRLGRRLVGVATGATMRDNPVDLIAPMLTAAGFVNPSVHQVGLFFHCVRVDKTAA